MLIFPGQVKPRGIPRINLRHPLAAGLIFYGYDTGAGDILDLVANRRANYVGTKPAVSPSPFGAGFLWNNSGSANFAQDALIQAATTGIYSYACGYVQTGTVGQYSTPFGRTANNNLSQPYTNWDFEINSAGIGQNQVKTNVNAGGFISTSAAWTGNANNVFTSLVNNVFGSAQHFSAQGKSINTTAASGIGSYNTNANVCFSGSSAAASNNPFVGFVHYGAFWSRPLLGSEIELLYTDPYSFLIFPGADLPPLRGPRTIITPSAAQYAVSIVS